jgi:hypothetical protein
VTGVAAKGPVDVGPRHDLDAVQPLPPKRGPRRRHPEMLPEAARPRLLGAVNTARDEMVVTWLSAIAAAVLSAAIGSPSEWIILLIH